MAKIKIVVEGPLMDGHRVTFKAPCACHEVEGLNVCYIDNDTQVTRLFVMKDTHGNVLTGIGNLFAEGAYVHAILDRENGFAYIQNPDTNGYIEENFQKKILGYDYENRVDIFNQVLATPGGYTVPCAGVVYIETYSDGKTMSAVQCNVNNFNTGGGSTITVGTVMTPAGQSFSVGGNMFPVFAGQIFSCLELTTDALGYAYFYPYYYG